MLIEGKHGTKDTDLGVGGEGGGGFDWLKALRWLALGMWSIFFVVCGAFKLTTVPVAALYVLRGPYRSFRW